jgi:DNA polymerase-3 subunit epsilon
MERADAESTSTGSAAPTLPRFAVVDIETSGLSTRRHRMLQVAVVTVENNIITDEWSSFIKLAWPLQRVGPRNVHGLDRATLRHAPAQKSVLPEIAERLNGAIFTAHNVRFDLPFIHRASRRSGIPVTRQADLCTLTLSRLLDPDRQMSHRLADVCARYGVTNDRPHDALHDARATALVLPHLLEAHGVRSETDLSPLYTP